MRKKMRKFNGEDGSEVSETEMNAEYLKDLDNRNKGEVVKDRSVQDLSEKSEETPRPAPRAATPRSVPRAATPRPAPVRAAAPAPAPARAAATTEEKRDRYGRTESDRAANRAAVSDFFSTGMRKLREGIGRMKSPSRQADEARMAARAATTGFKSGGVTASKRADGIAQRGKTRGKIC